MSEKTQREAVAEKLAADARSEDDSEDCAKKLGCFRGSRGSWA
jgi:hypothetical protein